MFNKKSIHKIITLLSSSSLILLILLTGTPPSVNAVYLSPGDLENDEVLSGSTVVFRNVTLTIRSEERIPIDYLKFTVYNSLTDQEAGYTKFTVHGNKLMDSPTNSFDIERTTPISTNWYGYGYNYGYDEYSGYEYDFGYDFGYGYGNSSFTDITIKYDITFTSTLPGAFYATIAANCTSYEFQSDTTSDFLVISQYPPIPQKEQIMPNSLSAVTGIVNFTYDFIDLEGDLDYLSLQISGPAPYNTNDSTISWEFTVDEDDPMKDWTTAEKNLAQNMGVNASYDALHEQWILTIDTLKNWSSTNPWNQSINSSVWPSGGYNFSIEVADTKGNTWGSISDYSKFSTYLYSFHTIQPVIDQAQSEDTVYVLNGTFSDQILINKNIHLKGSGSSIIQPEALPQSGVYDVKLNSGSSGTIIENLIFDFNGKNDNRSGMGCSIGQASLLTRDITLKNNIFYPGNRSGVGGIAIQTVTNSDVSDLSIRYNKIFGNDTCNGNGIFINPFYGPGNIEIYKNQITGNISYGISIQSSNVHVSSNILDNTGDLGYAGIRFIDTFGGMTFTDVVLVSNTISHFDRGMVIGNPSSVGSSLEAEILSNTVFENEVGILVQYDAILQNSVHFNNIVDNGNFGINNVGSASVNATINWWGDASGPYHSTNPTGLGDPVSNNVVFANWLETVWNNTAWVDDNYDNETPGWGIDHFNTTSDGINAVFDGGFVNLNPGTYAELLTIDKPLTLQAKYLYTDSTVITDEEATYSEFNAVNGQTIQIESNDVTIHGLKIKRVNDGSLDTIAAVGNNNYPYLYNVTITNCSIQSIYDGVYLNHVENVILCNNSNITSDQSGVHFNVVNASIIKQNHFDNIDTTGITCSHCVDMDIMNNSFSHKLIDAVTINSCDTVIIKDSLFENNTNGVFIADSININISDSNFTENLNGIRLFGLSIASIENNSFFNNTWNITHAAQVENYKYYGSIQNAILHAGLGNNIHLYHGTYYENLIIDKKISLKGFNPSHEVIIDGQTNGPAIVVGLNNDVHDVKVSGVTLNSSATIFRSGLYSDVSGLIVENCIIEQSESSSDNAVIIDPHQYSDYPPIRNGSVLFDNPVRLINNTIRGGVFYQYNPFELYDVDIDPQFILQENDIDVVFINGSIAVRIDGNHLYSITASNSYDLSILNNQIVNDPGNIRNGIDLWSLENESLMNKIRIHNNSIIGFSDTGSSTGISGAGIVLAGGKDVSIDSNFIYANSKGIYVVEDCINRNGMQCIGNISGLTIRKNDFELGQTAIMLRKNVSNAEIVSNNLSNNGQGIWLREAFSNTIHKNRITDQYYGIRIDSNSSNNLIYNNYFKDNNVQALDQESHNQWNVSLTTGENIVGGNHIGGNYWDTYDGIDTDGDYIGDTLVPFTDEDHIHNGGDYLPLLLFDDIPPMVTVLHPNGGEVFNTSSIKIRWDADDNQSEIANVTLYYSDDNGTNWVEISDNEENDGEYIWDIDEIPTGDNYTIKIVVYDIAGNTNNDTSDGVFGIEEPMSPGVNLDIVTPVKGWVYFFNTPKVRLFQRQVIIFGHINIEAEIESSISIDRVEFYIDDQLMKIAPPNEDNIYEYRWDEDSLFYHTITVKAYDEFDRSASKSMGVVIFNFGIIP